MNGLFLRNDLYGHLTEKQIENLQEKSDDHKTLSQISASSAYYKPWFNAYVAINPNVSLAVKRKHILESDDVWAKWIGRSILTLEEYVQSGNDPQYHWGMPGGSCSIDLTLQDAMECRYPPYPGMWKPHLIRLLTGRRYGLLSELQRMDIGLSKI